MSAPNLRLPTRGGLDSAFVVLWVAQAALGLAFTIFLIINWLTNRRLAPSEKVGLLFGHSSGYGTVIREYRRLIPNGMLHVVMYLFVFVAMWACLLAVAALLFFDMID
jgi:hypothetical protein